MLKPEDVEEDLVPAMEAFLRDMEEVSIPRSATAIGGVTAIGEVAQEPQVTPSCFLFF